MSDLTCLEGSQIQQFLDSIRKETLSSTKDAVLEICRRDSKARQRILKSLLVSLSIGPQANAEARAELLRLVLEPCLLAVDCASIVCDLVEVVPNYSRQFLTAISDALLMSPLQRALLGLGLSQHPVREKAIEGLEFIKTLVPSLKPEEFALLPKFVALQLSSITYSPDGSSSADNAVSLGLSRSEMLSLVLPDARVGIAPLPPVENVTAGILRDFGPQVLTQKDILLSALRLVPNLPSPSTLAEIVLFLANQSSASGSIWNSDIFLESVKEIGLSPDWVAVTGEFDLPGSFIMDSKSFAALLTMFRKALRDVTFPSKCFLKRWKNEDGQLSFLKVIIQMPPDLLALTNSSQRKVTSEVPGFNNKLLKHLTWNSLDLFDVVLSLIDERHAKAVRDILDTCRKQFPEILLVALFEVRRPYLRVVQEFVVSILRKDILRLATHLPLFQFLAHVDRRLFLRCLPEIYARDPQNTQKVLELSQDLKLLDAVLRMKQHRFALDMAVLASRREFVNLKRWAHEFVSSEGVVGIEAIVVYLADKLLPANEYEHSQQPKSDVQVPVHTASTLLDVVLSLCTSIAPSLLPNLKYLVARLHHHFPQLARIDAGSQPAAVPVAAAAVAGTAAVSGPESSRTSAEVAAAGPTPAVSAKKYSEDIESRAYAHFKKLYSGELSVAALLAVFDQLKASSNVVEREVLSCAVDYLLDEYRFYLEYPENYLRTTAAIFGGLLSHDLGSPEQAKVSIDCLIDSMKPSTNARLRAFAFVALQQLGNLLATRYRQLIDVGMPLLSSQTDADSKAVLELLHAAGQTVAAATEQISEEVADKIHFIVNNLTSANADEKVEHLKALRSDAVLRYLAEYMVAKRASTEPNFHGVYLDVLNRLFDRVHHHYMVKVTLDRISALLQSKTIAQNPAERTVLKNLGSWLGSITLAKNQPILKKQLDLKRLLLESFEGNRMIVAVPFIAKVLEACAKSRVFRPPNPWSVGLLSVLVELYRLQDLKLNLKFEVEVLCKHLDLNIASVPVKNVLRSWSIERAAVAEMVAGGQGKEPPQLALATGASASQAAAVPAARASPSLAPIGSPPRGAAGLPGGPPSMAVSVAQLAELVYVNEGVLRTFQDPMLKTIVATALQNAVSDVLGPVVDRSVSISVISTRDLIRKDFMMESNEEVIARSAQLVARCLAGSLALVTCREPLRTSMSNNLRVMLAVGSLPVTPEQLDIVLQDIAGANLDLGCKLVEAAAVERAAGEALKAVEEICASRRAAAYRLVSDRAMTESVDALIARTPSLESIRGSLGAPGVGSDLQVYEEFAKLPAHVPVPRGAEVESDVLLDEQGPEFGAAASLAGGTAGPSAAPPAGILTVQQALERLRLCMEKIDRLALSEIQLHHGQPKSLVTFPRDHPVIVLLAEIPRILIMCGPAKDDVSFAFGKEIFKRLLEENHQFGLELAFNVLEGVRTVLPDLPLLLTDWSAVAEIDRVYRRPITFTLLRSGLLVLSKFDQLLASTLQLEKETGSLEFAVQLVRKFIIEERVFSADDFSSVLDVLFSVAPLRHPEFAEGLRNLVSVARSVSVPMNAVVHAASAAAAPAAPEEALLGAAAAGMPMAAMDAAVAPGVSMAAAAVGSGIAAAASVGAGAAPAPIILRERQQDVALAALFDEWMATFSSSSQSESVVVSFLAKLEQSGILRGSTTFMALFKTFAERAVDLSLTRLGAGSAQAAADIAAAVSSTGAAATALHPMDAFCKLVFLIIKFFVKPEQMLAKAALLKNVLDMFVRVLGEDAAFYGPSFNQRVYLRFLYDCLLEISTEKSLEAIQFGCLIVFSEALEVVHPAKVPAFAFAWLYLASHRLFMPKVLLAARSNPLGGQRMKVLMTLVLRFMYPVLQKAVFSPGFRMFYKGVLRILLVLVHDFPEFLCDHHMVFCDLIPARCIQLRNLVLSAFPSHMRLPDPFTPNLKVDLLPEIQVSPLMLFDPAEAIRAFPQLSEGLVEYMMGRRPGPFLDSVHDLLVKASILRDAVSVSALEAMGPPYFYYSDPLVHSLVLYVGMVAIEQLQQKRPGITMVDNAAMDIYRRLATSMSPAGCYSVFNAMANQLRFPNNQTHFFSCVLLFMFVDIVSEEDALHEQITRVLLERLVVNRPHPWGLLITFIELVKNPRYNFWQRKFINCAPEIKRLFDNVAKSCESSGQQQQQQQQQQQTASAAGAH